MVLIQEIIDKHVWEEFLTKKYSGFFPFFQTWNWGEVQRNIGQQIWRLGIYEDETLVGVCLLIEIKAKRGHFFHLRHGPILLNLPLYFDTLLDHVKTLAQQQGASFLRISPLIPPYEADATFLKKRGFRESLMHSMDAELCWVLDIALSEEDILRNMRKSHRYLIRKAPSYGLKIHTSTDPEKLDGFMNLYKKLAKRMKFVPHKSIHEEFAVSSQDNQEMLFSAEYEGKIISCAIVAFVGNMAIYRHGASYEAYRNIPASYAIQWEAIKEAKKRGLSLYNFWGVAPENAPKKHPWSGFTLFKTGFGGERKEFLHAMDLPLSMMYWKNYMADYIDKLRKGY